MPTEESLEVLLVDDELSTREILEQFCRSRNLAVTVASDGRAAITALERNPSQFTVVLTDINMPGADGFEVLKAARAANRGCYVVMITGYATLDSALRAVREGAYDYLAKPFSLGQLDVMLARIKDRISLERENRDLRRRLQGGGRSVPPPRPDQFGGPPAPPLQNSVLPQAPAAPHPTYGGAPAIRASQGLPAPPVQHPPQPSAGTAVDQRVATMEDRLARMEELLRMVALLSVIAEQLKTLPNKVAIEGHTDSRPYSAAGGNYSNWELSSDRANAARRVMEQAGLSGHQVEGVRGFADTRLRSPETPLDPGNRRISIVVRRG